MTNSCFCFQESWMLNPTYVKINLWLRAVSSSSASFPLLQSKQNLNTCARETCRWRAECKLFVQINTIRKMRWLQIFERIFSSSKWRWVSKVGGRKPKASSKTETRFDRSMTEGSGKLWLRSEDRGNPCGGATLNFFPMHSKREKNVPIYPIAKNLHQLLRGMCATDQGKCLLLQRSRMQVGLLLADSLLSFATTILLPLSVLSSHFPPRLQRRTIPNTFRPPIYRGISMLLPLRLVWAPVKAILSLQRRSR